MMARREAGVDAGQRAITLFFRAAHDIKGTGGRRSGYPRWSPPVAESLWPAARTTRPNMARIPIRASVDQHVDAIRRDHEIAQQPPAARLPTRDENAAKAGRAACARCTEEISGHREPAPAGLSGADPRTVDHWPGRV